MCDLRLGLMMRQAWPSLFYTHPSLDSTPCQNSETLRNVKREGEIGSPSSNLTETQNKSSIASKFVDMAMENMYCKIIGFALFHLYFTILDFYLQKAHYFLSILHFLLRYHNSLANIRHCFDSMRSLCI